MGKTHFKVGRLVYIILIFSAQNQSSLDTWCKKIPKKKFPNITALENSGNGCKCSLCPLGAEAHSFALLHGALVGTGSPKFTGLVPASGVSCFMEHAYPRTREQLKCVMW
jgi:hypothetical protein